MLQSSAGGQPELRVPSGSTAFCLAYTLTLKTTAIRHFDTFTELNRVTTQKVIVLNYVTVSVVKLSSLDTPWLSVCPARPITKSRYHARSMFSFLFIHQVASGAAGAGGTYLLGCFSAFAKPAAPH